MNLHVKKRRNILLLTLFMSQFMMEIPVPCYFTDKIHLACRSYFGENVKGEEQIKHRTVSDNVHIVKSFLRKVRKK